MVLTFNYYVLSNLTLTFSLSHKKLFCVAPSATELNYPFKIWVAPAHFSLAAQNTLGAWAVAARAPT